VTSRTDPSTHHLFPTYLRSAGSHRQCEIASPRHPHFLSSTPTGQDVNVTSATIRKRGGHVIPTMREGGPYSHCSVTHSYHRVSETIRLQKARRTKLSESSRIPKTHTVCELVLRPSRFLFCVAGAPSEPFSFVWLVLHPSSGSK